MSQLDNIIQGVWADGTYAGNPYKDHPTISPETAKQRIKDLMLELIKDSMPQGSYHVNTEVLQEKVKNL
jgi:hypothetical protein